MLTTILNPDSVAHLKRLLDQSKYIVITCHLSPDGDAMGSSLALYRVLTAIGKKVKVVVPDTPPKYLMFLPGADQVVIYSRNEQFVQKIFASTDLIFCLDYNEPKRVDLMADILVSSPAKKVMIDHHLDPSDMPDVVISHPEESATASLIYRVLHALGLGDMIDTDSATCIYTGMMTDTGNFSYNSNKPDLYEIVADLIRKGINKDAVYQQIYFCDSFNRLRLNGFALYEKMQIFPEHKAALITLTRDELNRFQYQKGDTEALVNRPLTIPDVVYSVFLREETDYIKVSTRSKGSFPVNKICEAYYNGGGHLNAAGGEFIGTMEEAVEVLHRLMPEYDQYLPADKHEETK